MWLRFSEVLAGLVLWAVERVHFTSSETQTCSRVFVGFKLR